jgi:4-amino-4-deoxy-L-arabinose transferase-like glycosyltransferase
MGKLQIANIKFHISNSKGNVVFVICHLTFLLLALLLRLAPLGRYVTPDEPAWVYRSIRFADALAARDWAAVPSTGHPGVTTMWLGALNVTLCRLLSPAESTTHLDWIGRMAWLDPENSEAFRHLAFFLPGGRIAVALVTTAGLAILYPLLQRLFDRRLALLALGLLALDPFLSGHSGILHTDALLATFTLLALVATLNGLREPRRAIWWMLSGLFTGLALLTKTPAIILVPFIGLVQLTAHFRKSQILRLRSGQAANHKSSIGHWPLFIIHCSLFILVIAVICFALYPALWANPRAVLNTLLAFSERHIEMAQRPVFFVGQMTYDPGPLFYPAVFLFRISPIVLVGLVVGLVALRRLPTERRLAFITPIAFSVIFGAMMSLGVKKHDRYLLPALPPLTLAAGVGWSYLKHSLAPKLPYLLLPIQLLLALAFLLHPLTCANPLAGGPWIAARVIDLDWGEAMGEAARWLNQQPDAEQLTVATNAVPTFASIFKGRAVPLDRASLADYIALPGSHTPTPTYPIVHTVTLGLIDRAAIYTNTNPTEQAAFLTAHAEPGDLILLDADTPLLRQYTGPGTVISLADLPTQAAIAERLNDLLDTHSRIWLVADPAAPPFTSAYARQSIESIATPITSETIGATTIAQFTIHGTQIANLKYQMANFGQQITLVDAKLSNDARFVHTLLRWQVPGPTPTDLHFSLYLVDADGRQWNDVGQSVLDEFTFPTTQWDLGAWSDQSLRLSVPAHTPPGIYTVRLTVTDDAGAQLGAWDAEGAFQGVRVVLGEIKIAPPAKPAGRMDCAQGQEIDAGPLVACIAEPPPQAVPSGDAFSVAVIWSAAAAPESNYTTRWRLLDAAGAVAMEQTLPLSPYPTSRWRADDSFESRYDLRLDPTVPAARYTLVLNVLDPSGSALWSDDAAIGSIEVLHRDRQFDLPDDIGHPLDLTLGDVIHLRGFDLAATEGAPGDVLPLTLIWQADGPTDIDYTIFVHLVGPDGLPHGQLDVFPGGGAAPTSSLAPGQVIVDELALPIAADAASGTYHIAVGLYDVASGGRLSITDASGQRLPDDRFILPIEITVGGSP